MRPSLVRSARVGDQEAALRGHCSRRYAMQRLGDFPHCLVERTDLAPVAEQLFERGIEYSGQSHERWLLLPQRAHGGPTSSAVGATGKVANRPALQKEVNLASCWFERKHVCG